MCFTVAYACVRFIFYLPVKSHKYYLEVKSPMRFENFCKTVVKTGCFLEVLCAIIDRFEIFQHFFLVV